MATEIVVSFSDLRAQLENEKSSLYKIDANIKKIVQTSGRYSDRFNQSSNEYGRLGSRLGPRNSHPDAGNQYKNDESFGKRKIETKTVFSRLSAKTNDSDGEEDQPVQKRSRVSSAVSRELPTRAAILKAQSGDEQARTRNKRIFGALLGTLQKFKQEEIVLQTKEDKRAQVERKIEEQARQQKEKEIKERKTLFAERESKKATIKALEAKMARVQEFEKWEESQRCLGNFILTKTKPLMYWLPKKMSEKAEEKLASSKKYLEKHMLKKRQELEEELQRIEMRCHRPRGPGFKENHPDAEQQLQDTGEDGTADGTKKRDKFAMEVDKDESDDEQHQEKNGADGGEGENTKPEESHKDEKMDESVSEAQTHTQDASPNDDQEQKMTTD